ncbi:hypothetical protein BRO54_2883 [Geobacillus proteiniphilus]|uniref:Uncharacterized protein n=1 Tax=Geobacillus proteiniphilus TaxID=860353 RepID=A0A1Q5SSX4_9BACL|nr:hypothetical protein BRO54_2883 [Geobacillus proteiniphilus]
MLNVTDHSAIRLPLPFLPLFHRTILTAGKAGGEGCLFDSLMNKTRASSHQ